MDENEQNLESEIEEVLETSDIDSSLENCLYALDERLRELEIKFQSLVIARKKDAS